MPSFIVETNAVIGKEIEEKAMAEISRVLSRCLGKSENWVMVTMRTGVSMMFGGKKNPCAFCTLASIGKIEDKTNSKVAQGVCGVLKTLLNVPKDRVYMEFRDVHRDNFGWNGTTFTRAFG